MESNDEEKDVDLNVQTKLKQNQQHVLPEQQTVLKTPQSEQQTVLRTPSSQPLEEEKDPVLDDVLNVGEKNKSAKKEGESSSHPPLEKGLEGELNFGSIIKAAVELASLKTPAYAAGLLTLIPTAATYGLSKLGVPGMETASDWLFEKSKQALFASPTPDPGAQATQQQTQKQEETANKHLETLNKISQQLEQKPGSDPNKPAVSPIPSLLEKGSAQSPPDNKNLNMPDNVKENVQNVQNVQKNDP